MMGFRRSLVAGSIIVATTNCTASPSQAPVATIEDPRHATSTQATAASKPPALDVGSVETPFDRPSLSPTFVRAERIRRVVMSHDRLIEDGWLRGVVITVIEFDPEGRPLLETTTEGRSVTSTKSYRYEGERLVLFERSSRHAGPGFTRYEYDEQGRLAETTTQAPGEPPATTRYEYGAKGEQVVLSDDGTRSLLTKELAEGRIVRETLRREGSSAERTRSYDDEGRLMGYRHDDGRGRVDRVTFTYDESGRLTAQAFHENDKAIYRRHYSYDQEGLVIRERLESYVPAMGMGERIHYEYERHGDPPSLTLPERDATPTPTAVVAAVVAAFPGAYPERATVQYEQHGPDQVVVEEVAVFIPEAIASRLSHDQLTRQACQAKNTLGYDCACEQASLGSALDHAWSSWPDKRVVRLTIRLLIAC